MKAASLQPLCLAKPHHSHTLLCFFRSFCVSLIPCSPTMAATRWLFLSPSGHRDSKCSHELQADPVGGGAQELQTQTILEVGGQVAFATNRAANVMAPSFQKPCVFKTQLVLFCVAPMCAV